MCQQKTSANCRLFRSSRASSSFFCFGMLFHADGFCFTRWVYTKSFGGCILYFFVGAAADVAGDGAGAGASTVVVAIAAPMLMVP